MSTTTIPFRNIYGAVETNGLENGPQYHADFDRDNVETVDWTDPRLAKITRLRLLSDPGFPVWDVSYVHGMLKDGRNCRVEVPFSQLPKKNRNGAILDYARKDRVFAKALGVFDAISTLI